MPGICYNRGMNIPNPNPELISALNACRMRKGPSGVSFEPISGATAGDNVIAQGLREMGIRPVGRFYNLSECVVRHFQQFGLVIVRGMDLVASKRA